MHLHPDWLLWNSSFTSLLHWGLLRTRLNEKGGKQLSKTSETDTVISSSNMWRKLFSGLLLWQQTIRTHRSLKPSPGNKQFRKHDDSWVSWASEIKQRSKTIILRLLIEVLLIVHRRFASNMRHVGSCLLCKLRLKFLWQEVSCSHSTMLLHNTNISHPAEKHAQSGSRRHCQLFSQLPQRLASVQQTRY